MNNHASRHSALGRRLALAGLSLALALGVVEAGLRYAGTDLNPDPCLRFHSTVGWTLHPTCKSRGPVSPLGFRHQPPTDGPEARRRIVVLGDSFALATAFHYPDTFPGLLQSRLNQESESGLGPVEVANLSGSDWGTAQQLLAFRLHGLEPLPEAVVLQVFPFNDVCNNNLGQALTCSHLDPHRPYFVATKEGLRQTSLSPLRTRLRSISRLFGIAENRLGWGLPFEDPDLSWDERKARRRTAIRAATEEKGLEFSSPVYSLVAEPHQPKVLREGWEVTERLLREIASLCRDRGVPLVAIVIPFAEIFNPEWLQAQRASERHLVPEHGTGRVESILETLGVPVVSVRSRIENGELDWRAYFFPHGRPDRHFSKLGHSYAADWILEELRSNGEI